MESLYCEIIGVKGERQRLLGGASVGLDGLVMEGASDHCCHCDNEEKVAVRGAVLQLLKGEGNNLALKH